MDLPAEIRLQIYQWLLLLHPLHHAQLAPWYPTPIYSAYHVGLVQPSASKTDDSVPRELAVGKTRKRKLQPADRPISGLPTALLLCSKQIYQEARHIPFIENEFVFVNWFSSGLWGARAFVRPLADWQKSSTRHVRIELLARDFTGPGLTEWVNLCQAWSKGLRSMRLKILIGGGLIEPAVPFSQLNNSLESQAMNIFCDPEPRPAWIKEGLELLRSLEALEVDLAALDWDCDRKLEWCAALERMLNSGKSRLRPIDVLCVSKLPSDTAPPKETCAQPEPLPIANESRPTLV